MYPKLLISTVLLRLYARTSRVWGGGMWVWLCVVPGIKLGTNSVYKDLISKRSYRPLLLQTSLFPKYMHTKEPTEVYIQYCVWCRTGATMSTNFPFPHPATDTYEEWQPFWATEFAVIWESIREDLGQAWLIYTFPLKSIWELEGLRWERKPVGYKKGCIL